MTVTPIAGKAFCFEVSSRSRVGHVHYVDWMLGSCSCETFAFKNRGHREAHGTHYICPHMEEARAQCFAEIIQHAKETLGK